MAAPKPLPLLPIPAGATATQRAEIVAANRDIIAVNRQQQQAYLAAQREDAAAKRAATAAARQPRSPRQPAVPLRGRGLTATSILPESPEVRFVDAAINVGVAAGTSLWTATRPTISSQVGWGIFWAAVGALMFVEGRGELRYAGGATSAANATVLALLAFHPQLRAAA